MIVSRAIFLKVCGAAAIGVAAPRWASSAVSSAPAMPSKESTSGAARFRAHVGTTFTIDGQPHRVRLTGVTESRLHPEIEQFSLVFAGEPAAPLEHGTYRFRHPALGSIDMFISPVGKPGGTPVYEACFSQYAQSKGEPCRINS